MNSNLLSKNIFFNQYYFFQNDVTKKFAKFYFQNNSHKYDLYHFYIFRSDFIINKIKDFLNGNYNEYDSENSFWTTEYILKHALNKNFFNNDGNLNLLNDAIIKISLAETFLFIGEFKKYNKICNLFIKIDPKNYISGYAIDVNENDYFFQNHIKYKIFDNKDFLDIKWHDEIKKNILLL